MPNMFFWRAGLLFGPTSDRVLGQKRGFLHTNPNFRADFLHFSNVRIYYIWVSKVQLTRAIMDENHQKTLNGKCLRPFQTILDWFGTKKFFSFFWLPDPQNLAFKIANFSADGGSAGLRKYPKRSFLGFGVLIFEFPGLKNGGGIVGPVSFPEPCRRPTQVHKRKV